MKVFLFAVGALAGLQGLIQALPADSDCAHLVRRDGSNNKCGPPQVPTTTASDEVATTTTTTSDEPSTPPHEDCNVFAGGFAEYEVKIVGTNFETFGTMWREYNTKVESAFSCLALTTINNAFQKLTYTLRSSDADILRTWPETASVTQL
ncbi:hypothetical protein H4R33_000424 [Dimargaris cristalligena]|uniref:Uncharacterized protein n=1 Tax=Dimargaris cristalligena TaxID=215637 RepID=A0A4P9ZYK4_9FUNG|nr:hypothetical protein H4R33_000424 [Dimargaris cristalligena]RKP38773.1 hypothetical protein BJ085DRAFT_39887 [Dimargaris cristalligena]|eukprot:RKP38773.1 hypothetical protein BJ085DRAFT_39887 [Dimargaris cristalligena]